MVLQIPVYSIFFIKNNICNASQIANTPLNTLGKYKKHILSICKLMQK